MNENKVQYKWLNGKLKTYFFFILVYHKMVWHQTVIAEVAACICQHNLLKNLYYIL